MTIEQYKRAVLDSAIAWHSRGVTPIPVVCQHKRAAIPWREWQDRLPPLALVLTWFSGLVNLGLICGGPGRLVVLDFDDIVRYVVWRHNHPTLAETYTVKTARGMHAYFMAEPPARSFALNGVDVKASGYVLTAPSIHPNGTLYQVINPSAEVLALDDLGHALDGISALDEVGADAPRPNIRGVPSSTYTVHIHDNHGIVNVGGDGTPPPYSAKRRSRPIVKAPLWRDRRHKVPVDGARRCELVHRLGTVRRWLFCW